MSGTRQSAALPEREKIEEESNFWFSVRNREDQDDGEKRVPWYPNLDYDGPLPEACYSTLSDPAVEPKPNCLVSVDFTDVTEDDDAVSFMQNCIDSGLTALQGSSPLAYNQLLHETPGTVLNRCNLMTSVRVPKDMSAGRDALLGPLQEMGGSCIDTLQIQWNPRSPLYFLDLLDIATDLQREGLVRSIVGYRLPVKAMREAHACGFVVESNQIPANLLNPCSHYNGEMLLAAKDTDMALVLDSVLAGGFLSHRHYNQPAEPYLFELSKSERRHKQSVYKWSKEHGHERPWDSFQSDMMNVLHHIALKHRVSIETVALRWALQLEAVSSIVVPWSTQEELIEDQPLRLRQIFSVELDEEDEHQLWEASGCELPTKDLPALDFENLELGDNGIFLPSDGALWGI